MFFFVGLMVGKNFFFSDRTAEARDDVADVVFLDKINDCGTTLCQVKGGSYFGVPGRMNLPESWTGS